MNCSALLCSVTIITVYIIRRNQELDDKAVIRKLRIRIAELENEVALLRQTSDFTITREVRENQYYTCMQNGVIFCGRALP